MDSARLFGEEKHRAHAETVRMEAVSRRIKRHSLDPCWLFQAADHSAVAIIELLKADDGSCTVIWLRME